VFKPYKEVLVGTATGAVSTLIPTSRKCPNEVRPLIDLIYEESGHYVASHLNHCVSPSSVRPLGSLSDHQVKEATLVLKSARRWVEDQRNRPGTTDPVIVKLTEAWYMTVPQKLGRRPDWKALCLNTSEKVAVAERLLEIVNGVSEVSFVKDIDVRYANLDVDLSLVAKGSPEYADLESWVLGTHSTHHYVKLKVQNIYRASLGCQRDYEFGRGATRLFHGTRNANLLSILRHGLSITHSTVANGAMFGRAIYFSDVSTKSSQYAVGRYSNRNLRPSAFLLVCDVDLGRICEFDRGAHMTKPPVGFDSVKGVAGTTLLHDEYVIYEPSRHKVTHLIEFVL